MASSKAVCPSPKGNARKPHNENKQAKHSVKTEVLEELRRSLMILERRVLELETDVSDLRKELGTLKSGNLEQVVENETDTDMIDSPIPVISHISRKKSIGEQIKRKQELKKRCETTALEKDKSAELNNQIAISHSKQKNVDTVDFSIEPSITRNRQVKRNKTKSRGSRRRIGTLNSSDRDLSPVLLRKNTKKDIPLFKCPNCVKSFPNKTRLACHNKIHTGERPFKCELCFKAFSQKGSLDTHVRRHLGEKTLQCRVCKLKFISKWELTKHFDYKHTTVRPFSCTFCVKTYVSRYDMYLHLRSHTREKPFACYTCEPHKEFRSEKGLERHVKNNRHLITPTNIF